MTPETIKPKEWPRALRKAFDHPDGDIMWRAGISRAYAIMSKERDHLLSIIKQQHEALEFYAHEPNYRRQKGNTKVYGEKSWSNPFVFNDGGHISRKALALSGPYVKLVEGKHD